MFPRKDTQLCVFYAVTPLAAGSGQAIGAVDLPIQRERHTQWPQVQASGVKGAFRDWFRRYYENNGAPCQDIGLQAKELTEKIFGKEEGAEEGGGGQAGAIAVSDARLLAFPVRSNVAPFVWVTCPAVLSRLKRDLQLTLLNGMEIPLLAPQAVTGYLGVTGEMADKVVLEDLAVLREEAPENIKKLHKVFDNLGLDGILTRLMLISDQNFSFLVRTACEVQAQIKIDFDSGTTVDGSLRYQELLPADSVLYSLVFFAQERIKPCDQTTALAPGVIRECVQKAISTHLQMGGDLTLGRGLLEVTWLPKEQEGGAK